MVLTLIGLFQTLHWVEKDGIVFSIKKEFIKDKPMEVLSCKLEYKNLEGDNHSTEDHKLILELKTECFFRNRNE